MKPPKLNENATFAGILLGLILGAVYAMLRITKRGAVRRKDLTRFGAGTVELETSAAIDDAKAQANARLDDRS